MRNLFANQYRVRVQGEHYTPQVWRWWWPFWVAADVRANEGGGTCTHSYATSRAAWKWIAQQGQRAPAAPVSFEYEPPPFRPVPVVPAVDIGPKPAITISVDDHLTPGLERARRAFDTAFDTAGELDGWTATSDGLPPDGLPVFVRLADRQSIAGVAYREAGGWYWGNGSEESRSVAFSPGYVVTHWKV